jgi:hypothetical protein
MSTSEKGSFVIPSKTVVVKPILRARNPLISDPEHEAFFLFGNATRDYCLPVDRQGNLISPFTSKEEQTWLEEELDVDLNYHKAKNNFWHTFKVKLGKDIKRLNLENPKHYLEYIMLKANKQEIAPDGDSMSNKATYRYALVSEEFETKKRVTTADMKIEAYMELGKLKDDKQAMIDFLRVYGKKVSDQSKKDFLVDEIQKIIDDNIEAFLGVVKDKENYELKLLIERAVDCGAVIKRGREYFLQGGDPLSGAGDKSILSNVLIYLKAKANQDILLNIQTRVKNAKD